MIFIILSIIAIFFLLATLFLLNFNRDPERVVPEGDNVVSPADGKVVSIIDTDSRRLQVRKGILGRIQTLIQGFERPLLVVSIFMNPFDVHVQRTPLEGKVDSIHHSGGRFHNAATLTATVENERCETVLKTKIGRVKVIQIAGFLTRRISNYLNEGYRYPKGSRLGRIHFGSQVTLIVPKKRLTRILVKKGQRVKAGMSVLAEYS